MVFYMFWFFKAISDTIDPYKLEYNNVYIWISMSKISIILTTVVQEKTKYHL